MLKPNAAFFFWVWLALFCSYGLDRGAVLPSFVKSRRWVMLVFAVVAAAGFLLSVRSVLSLSALRTGREAANAGVFDLAQSLFERARALDPVNPDIVVAQGELALRAFRSTSKVMWLDEAQRSFLKASAMSPNYYYNYLALSNIYNARGDHAKGNAALLRARAVSPYEVERDLQAFSRQK
jgi:tetratricopeptide (TPR) repeat protein